MKETLRNVVVNGRFLSRRVTGVERYANEVIKRLADRLRILHQPQNGIRGHVWEQFELPLRSKDSLLWSPCNIGPVLARRHVVTLHDTGFIDVARFYSWRFSAFYRCLVPTLLSHVSHIITVSEFSKRQIMRHFHIHEERITVIPHGADGFSPVNAQRVSQVIHANRLSSSYLLTVGSLKPSKNARALIEAWSRTKLAAQGVELAVVGLRESHFAKYSLDNPPSGVRFLGYVSDDDLSALYTGAMAFVFPSLYEGFGLPVVEAMACGTPVICSNTTSLPEVVGDAALLVDPADVDSIANAMKTIVDSGALRSQLRERNATRVGRFTWERTAEATWKVLQTFRR